MAHPATLQRRQPQPHAFSDGRGLLPAQGALAELQFEREPGCSRILCRLPGAVVGKRDPPPPSPLLLEAVRPQNARELPFRYAEPTVERDIPLHQGGRIGPGLTHRTVRKEEAEHQHGRGKHRRGLGSSHLCGSFHARGRKQRLPAPGANIVPVSGSGPIVLFLLPLTDFRGDVARLPSVAGTAWFLWLFTTSCLMATPAASSRRSNH